MKTLALNSRLFSALLLGSAALFSGCHGDQEEKKDGNTPVNPSIINGGVPRTMTIQPRAIAGTPRYANDKSTGGYAPTNVQAQLKINVTEGTKEVRVIRDSSDPFVFTKPYVLKNADPYAVRNYLEAAVGSKSVSDSPVQVTAVKFADGRGVVLVSAEEYRFKDSKAGKGLDSIVALLDRKGLSYAPEAGAHLYFPRISRAANLRDMLLKVGSYTGDGEFVVSPSTIVVDAELNALVVKAPEWVWREMLAMLKKYDIPVPEVRISYRVLEIYAENDDRIGVDFQSWKNNEGVDLFSAGTFARRNWGTFFTSGVQSTDWNRTSYWNFNPKWNTRYLDLMTAIGKAKCMARGVLVAQNRTATHLEVNSGFFYDRTFYNPGFDPSTATSIYDAFDEFTYASPNADTIQREAVTKIMPYDKMVELYTDAGVANAASRLVPIGYTMRMMGLHTGTNTYGDAMAYSTQNDSNTNALMKYLTGYVKKDGTRVVANYYNTDGNCMDCSPGIIHGGLQYPMVTDGFKFDLRVTPVVTGKAAKLQFDLSGISLLGWNGDGSARTSESSSSATVQLGLSPREFVIGGLRKSESVRGTAGLPWVKDIPVLGRALSTESESIKQSQLVIVAKVELSLPNDPIEGLAKKRAKEIVSKVNQGMDSRVGNMFFQQYFLDHDRADRIKRLDEIGETINDEYRELK